MSGISDFKKRQEEQKARQTGQLAAEVDAVSGKMINPHNPEYITKKPWYLGDDSGPSLHHQDKQRDDSTMGLQEAEEILARKPKFLGRATTYRKGACENCGAMTHKKKDCVERPRSLAKTAKVSGQDIAPDEGTVNLQEHGKLGWDGKRDQWAGYRAEDHERVIERYQQMEEERIRQAKERKEEQKREREQRRKEKEAARAKKRAEKLQAKKDGGAAGGDKKATTSKKKKAAAGGGGGGGRAADDATASGEEEKAGSGSELSEESDASDSDMSDSDSDYDSDEEDEDEEVGEFLLKDKDNKDFQGRVARQGGVGGAQMKVSVRNLRIREDTAKYLRNLDPNSAYYDPKTRAMRENPLPGSNPEEVAYAGDNYMRTTGDTISLARMQVFALEAQDQGIDIHAEANPTAAILAKKKFEESQETEKEEQRRKVRELYGADQNAKKPDARLLLGQTESWVEYSKDGRVVKGPARAVVRSKYQEDVQVNNHTSVWGSYYDKRTGKWGFKCCHSVIKQSYCTGEEGRKANEQYIEELATVAKPGKEAEEEEEDAAEDGGKKKKSKLTTELTARSELFGTDAAAVDLDEEKLKEAVKRQKAFAKEKIETDDRKRKFNSMQSSEVTKEDMEAYRLIRSHGEDPMAKISSDKLLEE